MSIPVPDRPVIVCVDGHEHSQLAVAWAAQEAALRRSWLVIAHISPRRSNHQSYATRGARALVQSAVELAVTNHPGLSVGSRFLFGPLTERLVELSATAQLMVIGWIRGTGGETVGSPESMAVFVTARGSCPLVLVGAHDDARTQRPGVVVALSRGQNGGWAACRIAAAEAELRGASLQILLDDHQRAADTGAGGQQVFWSVTDNALAELRAAYPAVPVTVTRRAGDVHAISEFSTGAELLVMGNDHHSARTASEVSGCDMAVLVRSARCPVLVADQHHSPIIRHSPRGSGRRTRFPSAEGARRRLDARLSAQGAEALGVSVS